MNIINHNTFKTKTYTIKEIYDAIILKGDIEHLRDDWYTVDSNGKVVGACILGKGAFNLNILASIDGYDEIRGLPQEEYQLDDFTQYSLLNQLNRFCVINRKWYKEYKYVGDTIVWWNDARVNDSETGPYILRTYKEILAMVFDVLSPIFKEAVEVAVFRLMETRTS